MSSASNLKSYLKINMAKNEITVRRPQGWPPNDWFSVSAKLMQVLTTKHDIQHDDECCNWCFDDFLSEQQIADIAVFCFGNDLPATRKQVKELVLIGSGDCPVCGSNDREAITGAYEGAQFAGDTGGFRVLGQRCHNCKYEDYNEGD